jgi:hypothetical protein
MYDVFGYYKAYGATKVQRERGHENEPVKMIWKKLNGTAL